MNTLALACLSLAGAGILYLGLAAAMVLRLTRRPVATPTEWPSVSILKPLHGEEPGLFENLTSFLRQDYPGETEVLLGVQSRQDPAIAVAERLIAAFPQARITLVIDERRYGTNAKVSNLVHLADRARYAVILLSDSDMRVGPDYLAGVIASLSEPGIGVTTCPYFGLPVDSLWAQLVGLGIDTHFLPGVATGIGLGIGHPCLGSTIALRRETLDAIGGFRAMADELADDHEIGRRVRALGLKLATTPFAIAHVCRETDFGALFAQELRWVRTIRQIEPAGHLGAVASHPLPFALMAFGLMPGWPAAAFVAGAIAARIGLSLVVERAFGLRPHAYWLVPLRDLMSGLVYTASFLGRSVSWRGRQFDVARSGALLPKGALPTTRSDAS